MVPSLEVQRQLLWSSNNYLKKKKTQKSQKTGSLFFKNVDIKQANPAESLGPPQWDQRDRFQHYRGQRSAVNADVIVWWEARIIRACAWLQVSSRDWHEQDTQLPASFVYLTVTAMLNWIRQQLEEAEWAGEDIQWANTWEKAPLIYSHAEVGFDAVCFG